VKLANKNRKILNEKCSIKLLDQKGDLILHECIKNNMIHGPCGSAYRRSPCMKDGKCSKFFPKKFQQTTIVDQDGYPIYRRRNNRNVIEKNGVMLDNHYVVPYKAKLLLKYKAHINVEWCNQSTYLSTSTRDMIG